MEIRYNLSREDYINFNIEYVIGSKIVRKFFYFQKILMALLLFLALFVVRRKYHISIAYLAMMYVLVYFGWAAIEGFLIRFIIKRKLHKDLDKDPKLIGAKTLAFCGEGIKDLSGGGNFLVKWKHIKFIEELENYIYIFTSLNSGYILPKRCVEEVEAKEIIGLVNSRIEK